MSTAPVCPQCGNNGVRTEQITDADGQKRMLWICELDHKFPGPTR